MIRRCAVPLMLAGLLACLNLTAQAGDMQQEKRVVEAQLGSTNNVHAFGTTLLCSQPRADDLAEAKKRGVKTIVTLRTEGEIDWDEPGTVRRLEMDFHRIPFRGPETLNDEVFDKTRKILTDSDSQPVLLHCGSANRVGAVWLAHRVLDDGIPVEQAQREARKVGLRTPGYLDKALDYIRRNRQ